MSEKGGHVCISCQGMKLLLPPPSTELTLHYRRTRNSPPNSAWDCRCLRDNGYREKLPFSRAPLPTPPAHPLSSSYTLAARFPHENCSSYHFSNLQQLPWSWIRFKTLILSDKFNLLGPFTSFYLYQWTTSRNRLYNIVPFFGFFILLILLSFSNHTGHSLDYHIFSV